MKVVTTFALALAVLTPAFAQEAPSKPASPAATQPSANYVALALSDGPTADQRLVISIRGTDTNDIVASAYRACYQRAAQGYMHTCQVWYGDGWIVGAVCAQPQGTRKFAIGDDTTSPDAAREKAIRYLHDVEKVDVSNCSVVGEYSANDMQTGLSVGKDKQ